eukprot:TRINITY_DN15829_c2_g1_i1.p1 TRINITY_DN15829_c2_g1~~TRINITY_DN15829_c2_g1_i1.p1  ORF type:complete len:241 (+),score=89.47 TRINITY_DN15829_c2_g1_i1:68-724(+)
MSKRKAAAAAAGAAKRARVDGGVLLFSPGASGKPSAECQAMLQAVSGTLGAELRLLGKGLAGLKAGCEAAQGSSPVYLCGHSNGSRQICKLLAAEKGVPPGTCKRVVLLGYPLQGPGGSCDAERLAELRKLPGSYAPLLLSGDRDDFLLRQKTQGAAALAAALKPAACSASASVVTLRGGTHSIPQCKGGRSKTDSSAAAQKCIEDWFRGTAKKEREI